MSDRDDSTRALRRLAPRAPAVGRVELVQRPVTVRVPTPPLVEIQRVETAPTLATKFVPGPPTRPPPAIVEEAPPAAPKTVPPPRVPSDHGPSMTALAQHILELTEHHQRPATTL